MKKNLAKLTNQEFDNILRECLKEMTAEQIVFLIPDIHAIASEHFSNEILKRWLNKK